MKKLFLLLVFATTSQFAQNIEKEWGKVIAFENEGKIKSADEIVSKIYKNAIDDKNEVQIIKCFFYKSKYIQKLEENAQSKILDNLQADIKKVSIPSKAILNLVYGRCLKQYFDTNRYLLYSRTKLDSTESKSFLTWTQEDFEKEIKQIYNSTIENEEVLKDTPLINYELIFDFLTFEKFKMQNLYEYLLNENILFLISLNSISNTKSNSANLHDLTKSSRDFISLNLDFIENNDLKKIIKLYQKIEKINPNQENEFKRLQFCYKYILDSENDYLNTLLLLQKKNNDERLSQKILFEMAIIYKKRASKESPENYNLKAVEILDSIISIKNRSNIYGNALREKFIITNKTLDIQLQKFTYANENARAFINYKNIDQVKISFFKYNQKDKSNFENIKLNKDSILNDFLSKNKAEKYISAQLINKKDYLNYSTEILLPQLNTGNYLVYFEADYEGINKKTNCSFITSTNLMVLASHKENHDFYTILDRKTGHPIENVILKSEHFTIKTNKNGIANYKIKSGEKYYNTLQVFKDNDTVYFNKNYINSSNTYINKDNEIFKGKIEFFLDRAIYRPGQTVYYKAIIVQKKRDKSTVVPKTTVKIIIENASNDELKSFEVMSNEFGSFSGEFILPKNGLTGNFNIRAEEPDELTKDASYNVEEEEHPFWDNVELENSNYLFKVEEYKRPKFEIVFDSLKKNYTLNQKNTVTGIAKAFSGSKITSAKVKYIVEREIYNGNWNYSSDNETIVTGETITDDSGKFNIEFTTSSDEDIAKTDLPVFKYIVKVDISDINGETRSQERSINIGYHTLKLGCNIPKLIKTKEAKEITLKTTNLNDEFTATKGEFKVYFLKPYNGKFKERTLPYPELKTIADDDFEKLFPLENNTSKTLNDEIGTLVYSEKFDTEVSKEIFLDFLKNYKSGFYKIVLTAIDALNNTIEDKSIFELIQSNDTATPNKIFTIEQLNSNVKKDGFVLLKLNSILPNLYIQSTSFYSNSIFNEQNIILEKGQAAVKIPIFPEFKNTIKIGFQTIIENESFIQEFESSIPILQSKLEFETNTFRSKIEPGSKEFWSFKLKQKDMEAEILASMYDSSLDQFTSKNWGNLAINEYDNNYISHKTVIGVERLYCNFRNLNPLLQTPDFKNETTNLIWFGFDFVYNKLGEHNREYKNQITRKSKKPKNAGWINGYVGDVSGPIPGISILVKGTQRSTISDFDGYYEIEAADGEELIFSFIGFKEEKITVNSKVINVLMDAEIAKLNEVVIVGYGAQKKRSMLGAVTRINSNDNLRSDIDTNLLQSLEGFAAGVQVTNSTGASPSIRIRGTSSITGNSEALIIIDGVIMTANELSLISANDVIDLTVLKDASATAIYGSKGANGVIIITTKKAIKELSQIKARTNLSETAFFFPHLKTDSQGKVSFNFTSPEALTQWKLRLYAHDKNATVGYLEKSIITQKDLMVVPNFPRFFREKDSIVITAKVSNMTTEPKTGIAILQLFDVTTGQSIDIEMLNKDNIKNFNVNPLGNTIVSWKIYIPESIQGVQYKVLAKSGNFSDGEENIVPVLTNNMLVTESIPVWVRENSKKEYTFENLKNNNSNTLRNHQFTFEYTSNPTWTAIQSLPYLMEYEHECAEQTFSRYYANALASDIINSNPKIVNVFESWQKNGKLDSKLEQNEELKSILLAETPWMMDAKSEDEKKNNFALLFDLNKMKSSMESTFSKLKQKQKSSGGFVWFDGGEENEYITRHILAGFGHLQQLNIKSIPTKNYKEIIDKGIPFIDAKFISNHQYFVKNQEDKTKFTWHNPHSDIHYLYTRSFYLKEYPLSKELSEAIPNYLNHIKTNWLTYSLYQKGMVALILSRFKENETAIKIIESLKETASTNEDWGMYWIDNKAGWYWYQAPIETQALLIEAFSEITKDIKSVDAMKVWLLKNKQTKNWPTTKSTTEAVYALFIQGTDWLSVKDNTIVKIGDQKLVSKKITESQKEAETGYMKLTWKNNEIKKEMATITIENKSKVPGFGGVYWQYFEDLDRIKNGDQGVLAVVKELYLKKNSGKGDELLKITSQNSLKIGDLVAVRLVISSKEDMEFVHLKDMRAACFEPVNVLSEYQRKDGLGYYQSTKDVATHFFFDQIKKGTYVLEYDIRVNNIGEFSNGITTIQSMYAPEFTSHTKGIRVTTLSN